MVKYNLVPNHVKEMVTDINIYNRVFSELSSIIKKIKNKNIGDHIFGTKF